MIPGRSLSSLASAASSASRRPAFVPPRGTLPRAAEAEGLAALLRSAEGRVLCITGAGCSTESGVPDYRSPEGSYSKGHKPMNHRDFVRCPEQRARYWARSLAGWRFFDSARPNVAHRALAALERSRFIAGIVTQNVDGLHQSAGSQNVVNLHGRNNEVACLSCHSRRPRSGYQEQLELMNAEWMAEHLPSGKAVDIRADGDAHLVAEDFKDFRVPPCESCGGIWMPTVVFFGGSLDPEVRDRAQSLTDEAHSLLVLGSSCQVFSAYRLVKRAADAGKPIGLVNIGETRVDSLVPASMRWPWQCGEALTSMCGLLGVDILAP